MTQVWATYLPNYTYRRIARGQQVDILTYLLIFLTFSQLPSLVARTNIQYTALALGKTNTAGSHRSRWTQCHLWEICRNMYPCDWALYQRSVEDDRECHNKRGSLWRPKSTTDTSKQLVRIGYAFSYELFSFPRHKKMWQDYLRYENNQTNHAAAC